MQSPFNRVAVIGLGYVGLPTAATLAAQGVDVLGVDIREAVVSRVNEGRTHIVEPDLNIIVSSVVGTGKLKAAVKPEPCDAFIIAVPTPVSKDNKPDMAAVESALAAIAPVLAPGNLVIIESTSPVGTTRRAAKQLSQLRPDLTFPDTAPEESDILMAYCPERILPGNTLRELTDNARLVGGFDHRSATRAVALYSVFAKGRIYETRAEVAEMAKLTENAYRDVNIAFANELSLICESAGIDAWEVIRLANLHPRVNVLQPGPGVGGHCIPVDPWFIIDSFPDLSRLMRSARDVNVAKEKHVCERIKGVASRYREPKIALLGLSYKPNVDDLRESPAVAIAHDLAEANVGQLLIVEPYVEQLPADLSRHKCVRWSSLEEAVRGADIIALLVAHDQFQTLLGADLSEKVFIDTVGVLRPKSD